MPIHENKSFLKTKRFWLIVCGVALVLAVAAFADFKAVTTKSAAKTATTAPKVTDTTTQEADKIVDATHFKGVVAVIRHSQLQRVFTYGEAVAGKKGNTAKTIFPTASLQKTMTAAMIMQVILAKKLSFNTSLATYYPHLPNAKKLTVRDLLNHTTGYVTPEKPAPELYHTETDSIHYALQQIQVQNNTDFQYDNVNYTLLAGILRKVTGKSYAENLEERIIRPLKLTHTFVYNQVPTSVTVAESYNFDNHDYNPDPIDPKLYPVLLGAGNLFMSVTDMAKVQLGLRNGKILTLAQFDQLTTWPKGGDYSAGWFRSSKDRYLVYGGFDDYPGAYSTFSGFNKKGTAGVVVFANQSTNTSIKDLGVGLLRLTN